jgi:hypothetical protein
MAAITGTGIGPTGRIIVRTGTIVLLSAAAIGGARGASIRTAAIGINGKVQGGGETPPWNTRSRQTFSLRGPVNPEAAFTARIKRRRNGAIWKERTMKTLMKSAIVAFALAGASMAGTTAPAQAAGSVNFYVGPDGAHIGYSEGYWYDRRRHRHAYRYPNDWRTYRHPLSWYRTHRNWYRDRDWYRR